MKNSATENDIKLLRCQLEVEKKTTADAKRARDVARELAAECRSKFAEQRQKAEIAQRTIADLQRENRNLESRIAVLQTPQKV
jgi:hypothetical protein